MLSTCPVCYRVCWAHAVTICTHGGTPVKKRHVKPSVIKDEPKPTGPLTPPSEAAKKLLDDLEGR